MVVLCVLVVVAPPAAVSVVVCPPPPELPPVPPLPPWPPADVEAEVDAPAPADVVVEKPMSGPGVHDAIARKRAAGRAIRERRMSSMLRAARARLHKLGARAALAEPLRRF